MTGYHGFSFGFKSSPINAYLAPKGMRHYRTGIVPQVAQNRSEVILTLLSSISVIMKRESRYKLTKNHGPVDVLEIWFHVEP